MPARIARTPRSNPLEVSDQTNVVVSAIAPPFAIQTRSCESVYRVTTGHALFDFDIRPFVVKVRKLPAELFATEVWTGMIRSITQDMSQLLC
jgi:hypothetical protein